MRVESRPISTPPQANWVPVDFVQEGTRGCEFFIGTSQGLLYYNQESLNRLFDNYCYGITYYGDRWYIFRQHVTRYTQRAIGQLISFRFDNLILDDIRLEANDLDPSVHQIDAWDNHLYLADAPNNRVIRYTIGEDRLEGRTDFFPSGQLKDGVKSENYVHLNSLFSANGRSYLVYHNHTTKSGRKSQIAVVDQSFNVEQLISANAGDAHNILNGPDGLMYCDSQDGSFVYGANRIEFGTFTRGLAVAGDYILVGGSDFAERDERDKTTGYIYVLDTASKTKIGEIRIPGAGSVYEIRLTDPIDLGISGNYERKQGAFQTNSGA